MKCEKRKVYSGVFCVTFLRLFFLRFSKFEFSNFGAFSAFSQKVKGFSSIFFCGIKKVRMKYEMCIVNDSYFVVRSVKIFTKHPRNTKYQMCIAGYRRTLNLLKPFERLCVNFYTFILKNQKSLKY